MLKISKAMVPNSQKNHSKLEKHIDTRFDSKSGFHNYLIKKAKRSGYMEGFDKQ